MIIVVIVVGIRSACISYASLEFPDKVKVGKRYQACTFYTSVM